MLIYFVGFLLILFIAFIDLEVKNVNNQKLERLRNIFFYFITIVLIFFVGLKSIGVGVDDFNYFDMYRDSRNGEQFKEVSYFIFSNLFSEFNYLLIFYAILGIGIKGIYIIKKTNFLGIIFLLYFSSFYFLHDFVQIRAGVASALILWILHAAGQKSYLKYIILCSLAVFFHNSAIAIIPIIFLKNKDTKVLYIFLAFISLFFGFVFPLDLNILTPIMPNLLVERFYGYLEIDIENVNLLNPIAIINYVLVIIVFANWNKLINSSESAVFVIKSFLIGIYLFLIFHSNITIYRIYELFLITQIPLANLLLKELQKKYLIIALILILSMIYFYYYVIRDSIVAPYILYL